MGLDVNFSITRTFFSTAFKAVADAECCFVSVQPGACGSLSDYSVFKYRVLQIWKIMDSNKLNIPDGRVLPSDPEGLSMSFVLVGDEGFVLSEHVIWLYPNKQLTCLERIYRVFQEE